MPEEHGQNGVFCMLVQIPHWLLMLDTQVDTGGRPPWEAARADSRCTLLGVLSALLQPLASLLPLCLRFPLLRGCVGPLGQSPALTLCSFLLCGVLPPPMCWQLQDLRLCPEPRPAGLPLLRSCFSSLISADAPPPARLASHHPQAP